MIMLCSPFRQSKLLPSRKSFSFSFFVCAPAQKRISKRNSNKTYFPLHYTHILCFLPKQHLSLTFSKVITYSDIFIPHTPFSRWGQESWGILGEMRCFYLFGQNLWKWEYLFRQIEIRRVVYTFAWVLLRVIDGRHFFICWTLISDKQTFLTNRWNDFADFPGEGKRVRTAKTSLQQPSLTWLHEIFGA